MSKRISFKQAANKLNHLLELTLGNTFFHITLSFDISVKPSWKIKERILDDYHLLFVKQGRGTYIVEDTEIALQQGMIIFLSDQIRHEAYKPAEETLRIIPLRFKIYNHPQHEWLQINDEPYFFYFTPRDPLQFQVLFEHANFSNKQTPSNLRTYFCHASIARLLAEICWELRNIDKKIPLHKGINKVKKYIDDHPNQRISIDELAKIAGLSSKYCSKQFRNQIGIGLKEYQIKVRLDYARFLLEQSNMSVKEVAYHLGYTDPFAFSKQFKQYTGISPSMLSTK